MRSLRLLILLAICAPILHARVGSVHTADGTWLSGHVRFTPAGVVIVNAAESLITTVPQTNVASIIMSDDAPAAPERAPFGVLPGGWKETEVGGVRVAGLTRCEGNRFTVRGAGSGIGGNYDSFHYVYQAVEGDREIVARITSVQQGHPYAMAGVMIREGMSEYARFVMLAVTAGRGGYLQVRSTEAQTATLEAQRGLRAGSWVKLRRRGNELSAFVSANGRHWTLVQRIELSMREQYYVGLAAASANDGAVNWATFDKVRTDRRLTSDSFTPIVELRSGSTVVGRPIEANAETISFVDGPRLFKVPTPAVARIVYQPLSTELAWKTRASRPGVWVQGGDFFDGSLVNISGDQVRMSSVLYGLRSFDTLDEVAAVVLANRKNDRPVVEIALVDGSVLFGTDYRFAEGEVVVRDAALGGVKVPGFMVREMRRR